MITPKELKDNGYMIFRKEAPVTGEIFFPISDQESLKKDDFSNNNYEIDYDNAYSYTQTESYELTIINKDKEDYVAIEENDLDFMLSNYDDIKELIDELYNQYGKKDTPITQNIKNHIKE